MKNKEMKRPTIRMQYENQPDEEASQKVAVNLIQ